ncbi:hypothetical protein HAZT_HAZT011477 [Hyalella azteca]|uniref:Endonuclease/exonuclease/phosphatase domain-containing protein n=1 Tax=Hyalella azteca TaxID=294128 RepID=A0A6A0H7G4_HYAAZ|nr:hypothetical protein HAZT_HAZT011477 [Hyalella azteca]
MQLHSLLLWNARGLNSKLPELKLFLSHAAPTVICITETHLQNWHDPRFPGYTTYRQDRADGFGGLLLLVRAQTLQRAVALDPYEGGQMQCLAVEIAHCGAWSRILLCYNPCCSITQTEFEHYFTYIGPRDLICGDFNAHHPLWSTPNTRQNRAGGSLFNVISNSSLMLLNTPGTPTRIDPHTGTGSVLDLIFGAAPFFTHSVSPSLDLGSDHTPLLLQYGPRQVIRVKTVPRWSLPHMNDDREWTAWSGELSKKSIPRGNTPQESQQAFSTAMIEHYPRRHGLEDV